MNSKQLSTQCCIVGGGPAGIMAGYLFARAGIDVIVLEKWPDFFRDFRGDTIHPATMNILDELGLLDKFLQLPHNETKQLTVKIGDQDVTISDFSQLNVRCPFIAFTPQWNFLNFITEEAKKFPTFHLYMQTEATNLIEENGRTVGVGARSANETLTIQAELVLGTDGRHSMVREKTHLIVESLSAPMDVLWFRLSRRPSDSNQSFGKIDLGRMMVMIERGDYWQCGFLIRKGEFDKIHSQGLEKLQNDILALLPSMRDRIHEIKSWDNVKLLTVIVDRLKKWYKPGVLCIGDAAHAMSPIGGVGINLAIQDAVAAANILTPKLLTRSLTEKDLALVQKRRELPTKIIQRMQVFIQKRLIDRVLGNTVHPKLPLIFSLLQKFPFLRRIPAYLIGIGIRPEHISSRAKARDLDR